MAEGLVEQLRDAGVTVNQAAMFSECCALLFAKSQYDAVSIITIYDILNISVVLHGGCRHLLNNTVKSKS